MAYPLLRSLPDTECAFLHYDYVAETARGAEYCGSEAATFIDLERLSFPLTMELVPKSAPAVGKPMVVTMTFKTSGGKRLRPWELAVVHTEKIHLFIVDPSLEDYHHLHPEPLDLTGQYRFSLTPRQVGRYKVFAELVPLASQSLVITEATFEVAGVGVAPQKRPFPTSEVGDYRFELVSLKPKLQRDEENLLTLKVTRPKDRGSIVFEPVMGAYAHMVAFDEKRRGLAHMHPLDNGVGLGTPEAEFHFALSTDLAGYYKLWAQVRLEGQDLFIPFAIETDS